MGRYQVPVVVHGQAEAVLPLCLLPVVPLDAPQVLLPHLPASGLSLLPRIRRVPQERGDTECPWVTAPAQG